MSKIQENAYHLTVNRLVQCVFLVGLIFSLAACKTTQSGSAPAPAADAAPSEEEIFDEAIHWSRNSAERRASYEQVYRTASDRIRELAEGREPGSWAVSLDADETLVDNSLYQVEIAAKGESFGPVSWDAWIQRKSAPALPGAVEFTHLVNELGGIVAVVTNRRHHQCAPTAENMLDVGIYFDVAMCRVVDGEKEPRFDALTEGTTADWRDVQYNMDGELGPVEVIMWVGDNIGDFPDQTQDDRFSDSALSDFGDRFFILPNPMYGSWEANEKK